MARIKAHGRTNPRCPLRRHAVVFNRAAACAAPGESIHCEASGTTITTLDLRTDRESVSACTRCAVCSESGSSFLLENCNYDRRASTQPYISSFGPNGSEARKEGGLSARGEPAKATKKEENQREKQTDNERIQARVEENGKGGEYEREKKRTLG